MKARLALGAGLRLAGAALAVLLLAGCGDAIKDQQLIEENRVLGARVEVQGDPERASPAPGESATVRWLVTDPGEPRPLSYAFVVCEAADVARGLPICAAPPFASYASGVPRLEEPSFSFTVPEASALTGAARLVIEGIVCANGTARLGESWEDSTCAGARTQQTLVSMYVLVHRDGRSNQNPSLGGLPSWLDDEAWPEPEPDWLDLDACADGPAELPRVRAGSGNHELRLEPDPGNREPLADDPLHRPIESLQVSHLSTAGLVERPFSVIEGVGVESVVRVSWKAPDRAARGGELVRFYFVARDLRGGVDWTVRALCVTP